MRAYSGAFDLRRYDPAFWVMSETSLEDIAGDLDEVKHFPIVSRQKMKALRKVSAIEIKLLDVVEWKRPKTKK